MPVAEEEEHRGRRGGRKRARSLRGRRRRVGPTAGVTDERNDWPGRSASPRSSSRVLRARAGSPRSANPVSRPSAGTGSPSSRSRA
jgi:hypothetical protein